MVKASARTSAQGLAEAWGLLSEEASEQVSKLRPQLLAAALAAALAALALSEGEKDMPLAVLPDCVSDLASAEEWEAVLAVALG